jgi:hypothetical protein
MGYISNNKRSWIYVLTQEGYPSRFIVKKENVVQSSVIQIKNKVENTGSVKDLLKSGCLWILQNEMNIIL